MKRIAFYFSFFVLLFSLTACKGDSPIEDEQPVDAKRQAMLETPLTLEAINDGTITFTNNSGGPVSYTIDGGSPKLIYSSTDIPVTAGQKVAFLGDNEGYAHISGLIIGSNIACTADCYVYGNVMSLISSTRFATTTELTKEWALAELFLNNRYIRNAPDKELLLPATTLSTKCYANMFWGCENLTVAPVLPAKTLTPACYACMFFSCTNLTRVTCLATDISAAGCTRNWLTKVAGTGTFVKASTMNDWPCDENGIPEGWTLKDKK